MAKAKLKLDDGDIEFKYNLGDKVKLKDDKIVEIISMQYQKKRGNSYSFETLDGNTLGHTHEDLIIGVIDEKE